MPIDLSLMLVTDEQVIEDRHLPNLIEEALLGGVTVVQFRHKSANPETLVRLGRDIKAITDSHGIPLIVNDYPDIAKALDCSGVHLGQEDASVLEARESLGSGKIIGLSIENLPQLNSTAADYSDYLGVSPIYLTATKATAHSWGLEGLRQLRAVTLKPLVAIGGINEANAADILLAGADGIAVVSAICAATNPRKAAMRLKEICLEAMKEKEKREKNL